MAKNSTNSGELPFAKELFEAADRMRGSVESAEYKHLVLGLLFLKYISESFERRRAWLEHATANQTNEDYFTDDEAERGAILEDRDEYVSENVFWVPPQARFDSLLEAASQPDIGERIDKALEAIEHDNAEQLRGVLPKVYARAPLEPAKLGALVGTVARIGFGDDADEARDVLGRTYEYFIREFARKEGHRGGEFYTPRSVTKLLVEMLEPYEGRVLDPACGSGGLFVQSAEFVKAHGGRARQISLLGQENIQATWRICRMNLAIHGLAGDIKLGDSLLDDKFAGARADYVIANPPFNKKKWGAASVAKDARWTYGEPPEQNANYAWIQHFIHHLAPDGRAGFVMANGSLTSRTKGEGEIRQRIVEADLVDCVVALPGQLFFTTGIPVCLWFIDRNKASVDERDRRGETLFIDARAMGQKISRTQIELSTEEVERITRVYHAWRGHRGAAAYEDVEGFCRSVRDDEIRQSNVVLTPGAFVGGGTNEVHAGAEEHVQSVLRDLRADATDTPGLVAEVEAALSALEIDETGEESELVPLTVIARFVNGRAFTKDANGRGRPIIRIKELNGGLSDATLYSDVDARGDNVAYEGDLLFSWSGSLDVYRWRGPESLINQHIFKVIPDGATPSWFVEAWLRRHLPIFQAIARDKATTMGHIQRHHLDEALVALPSPGALARLSKLMEPIGMLREARIRELERLEELRAALMRQLTAADEASAAAI